MFLRCDFPRRNHTWSVLDLVNIISAFRQSCRGGALDGTHMQLAEGTSPAPSNQRVE
jgi:hypothetical protein